MRLYSGLHFNDREYVGTVLRLYLGQKGFMTCLGLSKLQVGRFDKLDVAVFESQTEYNLLLSNVPSSEENRS